MMDIKKLIPATPALVGGFKLVFPVRPDYVVLLDEARMLVIGIVRRRGVGRPLVARLLFVC
jgi:hypothetical protein